MNISSIPIETNPMINNPEIGTLVMAKCLDTAETSGQNMVKMMEQSVNPNLGQNIDFKV